MKTTLLLLLSLVLCSLYAQNASIALATFHGCERHCGIYKDEGYTNFGEVKWKFKTNGKIFSSPAVADGVAFVGSADHNLYAINTETGKIKWKFTTGGAVHSSPAVYDNSVYFGSFDGHYYAVDIETGMEKWKIKTGGEKIMGGEGYFGMKPANRYHEDLWDYFLSSPVVGKSDGNVTIYFGSSDGKLYSVDARSGSVKWTFSATGSIHSTPALYNGMLYFGCWDSHLYALDAATGQLKWKFKSGDQIGMTGILASPAIDGNVVYVGSRDAKFYALDAGSGTVLWTYDAQGSWIMSTAAIQNGTVYTTTSDSFRFIALDSKTGKEKFFFKANGYVFSSPAISGNTAFFGDFTGKMFAVDLTSEGKIVHHISTESRNKFAPSILKDDHLDVGHAGQGMDLSIFKNSAKVMAEFYKLGPIVSSPVVQKGVIFFGSADGHLYAVNLAKDASPRNHNHH